MLYSQNQNLQQKIIIDYRTILNRFWKTLIRYAPDYPEVARLKQEVEQVHFNIILTDAHINHLQKICRLFDLKKPDQPIISKLHQEFCADLEMFKRGATINPESKVYF